MRLEPSGTNDASGVVKVSINDRFENVCASSWTIQEGMVVCRQLSLGYATRVYTNSSVDGTTGSPVRGVTGLSCNGTEANLLECEGTSWGVCDSSGVAGVECSTTGIFTKRRQQL